MTIQQEIISLIGKFDYTWYASIKKMFIAEKGYNPVTKRIKRTISRYGSDASTGEEYNKDLNIDCSIEEYAWDYDFESDVFEEDNLPVQGKSIALKIENIITDYITESKEIKTQDELITKVMTVIITKVNDLKQAYVDVEYSSVLSHFHKALRTGVSRKHGQIKRKANKQRSFEAFLSSEISLDAPDTYDSDEQLIRGILKPLNGRWLKTVIMKKGDFDILIANTLKFIENKGNDTGYVIKPFRTSSVPEDFIRYTFKLLYDEKVSGKIIQAKWAEFLKKSFDAFGNIKEESIRKKFATKPENYDNDLKTTITYQ